MIAVGCILSVLSDKLCDVYMNHHNARELWGAIEHKYGASDARHELYVIERYHGYKTVDNSGVVEKAHEIQCSARELQLLGRVLLDPFVAGDIIAKLPPSWRDFATALKHRRVSMSVADLLASLDIEEKARAKDNANK